MRKPLAQRAIIWLGAAFITYHLLGFLFQARPAHPDLAHPGPASQDAQIALVKTKGDRQRAAAIVEAFRFSWNNYETYAAPHDTLRPVSQTYEDDR